MIHIFWLFISHPFLITSRSHVCRVAITTVPEIVKKYFHDPPPPRLLSSPRRTHFTITTIFAAFSPRKTHSTKISILFKFPIVIFAVDYRNCFNDGLFGTSYFGKQEGNIHYVKRWVFGDKAVFFLLLFSSFLSLLSSKGKIIPNSPL